MLKRIQIIDNETKQVLTMSEKSNEAWAVENGFSVELYEVETAYNGNTYLLGYAPIQTDAELLNIAKEAKLQAWKEYDAEYRQTGTVEVDGKFFSISQEAKVNLTSVSLKAMATQGDTKYFQKNGDSEIYSYEEFMPLSLQIGAGIERAETNYYAVEAEILNAQSVEELEGIVWN